MNPDENGASNGSAGSPRKYDDDDNDDQHTRNHRAEERNGSSTLDQYEQEMRARLQGIQEDNVALGSYVQALEAEAATIRALLSHHNTHHARGGENVGPASSQVSNTVVAAAEPSGEEPSAADTSAANTSAVPSQYNGNPSHDIERPPAQDIHAEDDREAVGDAQGRERAQQSTEVPTQGEEHHDGGNRTATS